GVVGCLTRRAVAVELSPPYTGLELPAGVSGAPQSTACRLAELAALPVRCPPLMHGVVEAGCSAARQVGPPGTTFTFTMPFCDDSRHPAAFPLPALSIVEGIDMISNIVTPLDCGDLVPSPGGLSLSHLAALGEMCWSSRLRSSGVRGGVPNPGQMHPKHGAAASTPAPLTGCSHVWLRLDRVRKPLEAPYQGPFRVLHRSPLTFTLDISGTPTSVAIDRVKPARLPSLQRDEPTKATGMDEPIRARLRPRRDGEPGGPGVRLVQQTHGVAQQAEAHLNHFVEILAQLGGVAGATLSGHDGGRRAEQQSEQQQGERGCADHGGVLLEHKSEENVSRRRHEEGRTGRRSYRPVRPEQLQRVRLWLASDHRVEATKLVQTSHQLVVQVRVHAAELSRFELGFFQGHCTNANITASSSDLNLSSSSGKFAATNGSRSWSRHSTVTVDFRIAPAVTRLVSRLNSDLIPLAQEKDGWDRVREDVEPATLLESLEAEQRPEILGEAESPPCKSSGSQMVRLLHEDQIRLTASIPFRSSSVEVTTLLAGTQIRCLLVRERSSSLQKARLRSQLGSGSSSRSRRPDSASLGQIRRQESLVAFERAINSTSHLLQLVGEQARVLLQDDNRRLPLCRISVGGPGVSGAIFRWAVDPPGCISLPILGSDFSGLKALFRRRPRLGSFRCPGPLAPGAGGMAAESTAPAEAGGTVSSTAGRLLEHKSEENVSRRRHEEGRTGRRSYRPVRPEQLQRVRLWLASDHRVEATKLVQTSHQLVVQVRVHAAELSRFELGFFQGHCTNANITASSSDLNLSSSSGKFAATNGSRSWSRHSTTSPMEPRLRVALEAAEDAQLQSLCQQLDCNFELTVGGYKDWDKGERVQSVTHHVACKSHNLRCLKLLIDRFGSDCLKFRNNWDETAVQLAAEHQDDSWMELIRDTLGMSCFQDTARSGRAVAHYAAMNEMSNLSLKWLVKKLGSGCLAVPDEYGDTAVHLAAQYQSTDSMELMKRELGSDCFNQKGWLSRTAVHCAVLNPDSGASLEWLVQECGTASLTVPDETGNDAFRLAADCRSAEALQFLTTQLDIKQQSSLMESTLRKALEARDDGQLQQLIPLLRTNCQMTVGGYSYFVNRERTQPIAHHVVCKVRNLQCLKLLIEKFGPDCLTCRNDWAETVVHLAAKHQDASWIQLVRDALSEDCFKEKTKSGKTVTHYAAMNEVNNSSLLWLVKQLGRHCLTIPDNDGDTAVHTVAEYQGVGSMELIKRELGTDCFKDLAGYRNRTVFHSAATNIGTNAVLKWLVKKFGSECLKIPDEDGNTAVLLASASQGVESMRMIKRETLADFVEKAADADRRARNRAWIASQLSMKPDSAPSQVCHKPITATATNDYSSRSLYESRLRAALEKGDEELLQRLFQQLDSNFDLSVGGYKDFSKEEKTQSVAHHVVCKSRSPLCLKALINRLGAECLTCTNDCGETPVHLAAKYRTDSWMVLLQDSLKNDLLFNKKTRSGKTVTHYASMNKVSNAALKWIVKKFGRDWLTIPDEDGNTAVHLAIQCQGVDSMELIKKELGTDCFKQRVGHHKRAPFHLAAMNSDSTAPLEWLIRELGCDCLTVPDEDGNTAVHLAAQYQGVDSLQLIKIVLGRECLYRMKGFRDRTAVHCAATNLVNDINLEWLVQECGSQCLTVRDKHGDTAVHLAAQHQSAELLQYLADQLGHQMFALKNSKGENISDYVRMDKHSDRKFRKLSWLAGEKSPKQPNQPGPRPNVRKFEDGRTSVAQIKYSQKSCSVRAANSMNKSNNCSTASTVQKPRTVPQPLKKPIIRSGEFGKVYTTLADQIQTAATKILAKKSLELKILEIEIRAVKDIIYPTSIRQFLKCEFLKTGGFYSLDVLVSGHSLFELIERQLNLIPQVDVAEFARQVCSGLRCLDRQRHFTAHSSALCSNIVITTDGLIKVIDFPQAVASCGLSTNPSGTNHSTAPELLGCAVFELKETQQPSGDAAMFQIPMLTLTDSAMPKPSMRLVTALSKFYRRCKEFDAKRVKNSSEMLQHSSGSTPSSTEEPLYQESWTSVRLIGRGGFGEIHEVITDKGIRCATKTLKLPIQLGDELETLEREVNGAVESEKNLRRLQHDNIVKFLDVAQPEPATLVVFMELLDGRTLENYINNKPLDEKTVRHFSKQICSALLYMHSQEPPVIHRDINCTNIIVLVGNSRIKLIDFGLSIKLEHKSADIWAFGCSVFQMATGARPHADTRSLLKMAMKLSNDGAPALSADCSPDLQDFYSCCTAKDRTLRKSAAHLMRHRFLTTD
uniref:ANK_REP_REGION domain-containing protein n=1 Tax=Macrostomum lignano TaxID=282301 RepID=A0A1I8JCM5_9PLAT